MDFSVYRPGPPLSVRTTLLADEIGLLAPTGDIDMATAPLLAAAFEDLRREHAPRAVVVELAGVKFLGSAGLSCLANARADTELALSRLTHAVRRALEVGGLREYFPCYDTTEEARDGLLQRLSASVDRSA
ncbi:STAS domain-containing protein [Amycolatopsis magusensis]|uniref:STAS domain-containing protein n=1 Tax=Amycolatopsis magusensis TaxID=882444 RepID=UPI003C2CEA28